MKVIAFMGVDGAGKTTLAKWFCKSLKQKGFSSKYVKLSNIYSKQYHTLPNSLNGNNELIEETLVALHKINTISKNAYGTYDFLVFDRYLESLAGKAEISPKRCAEALKLLKNAPLPYLTFYIDVKPQIAKQRILNREKKTGQHDDQISIEKLEMMNDYYGKKFNLYPIIHVNGNVSIDCVQKHIMKVFETQLQQP